MYLLYVLAPPQSGLKHNPNCYCTAVLWQRRKEQIMDVCTNRFIYGSLCVLLFLRLSPSLFTNALNIPSCLDSKVEGVSNSAILPSSKTSIRSESMTVFILCAIVNIVASAKFSRILRYGNIGVRRRGDSLLLSIHKIKWMQQEHILHT